jgi:hypothetical protein
MIAEMRDNLMFNAQEMIAHLSSLILKEDDLKKLIDAYYDLNSGDLRKSQDISAYKDMVSNFKETRRSLEKEIKSILGLLEAASEPTKLKN